MHALKGVSFAFEFCAASACVHALDDSILCSPCEQSASEPSPCIVACMLNNSLIIRQKVVVSEFAHILSTNAVLHCRGGHDAVTCLLPLWIHS